VSAYTIPVYLPRRRRIITPAEWLREKLREQQAEREQTIALAVTFQGAALSGTTGTTSFTITTPSASIEVDDLLDLSFVHRGTGDGTVSDNSGDGVSWTRKGEALFGTDAWSTQHYWKRATSALATSDATLTVSGLTNSCAGALTIYRGVKTTGDPYEAWTAFPNIAAGTESVAGITTLTDLAWVQMQVGHSPGAGTLTMTSPLIERAEVKGTGGADADILVGSYEKTPAGATGTLAWTASINRAAGVIAYGIIPAGAGGGAIAVPHRTSRRRNRT
jgi:hypothetical protein